MTAQKLLSTVGFYALVVAIVVFSVFPFYYAIVTSFATGTELFKINYWPTSFSLANYESVLGGRNFVRSIVNSVFIATTTVVFALFLAVTASYALARVRFHTVIFSTAAGVRRSTSHQGFCVPPSFVWVCPPRL